jgi:hypothetical protein
MFLEVIVLARHGSCDLPLASSRQLAERRLVVHPPHLPTHGRKSATMPLPHRREEQELGQGGNQSFESQHQL